MRSRAASISLNVIKRLQFGRKIDNRQLVGRRVAMSGRNSGVPTHRVLRELWRPIAPSRRALAGKTFLVRIDRLVEAILQDIRR